MDEEEEANEFDTDEHFNCATSNEADEQEANEFGTDGNSSCATSNEADEPPPPLHQDLFDTDENFNCATSNAAEPPRPLPWSDAHQTWNHRDLSGVERVNVYHNNMKHSSMPTSRNRTTKMTSSTR